MVKPIPDNVQQVLNSLSGSQQVTLRAYIASLREELKDAQHAVLAASDPDPHAHYHGHEKCTSDHSHEHSHQTKDESGHEHSHGHDNETCTQDHSHEHSHASKKVEDSGHSHDHSHVEPPKHSHEHEHSHKDDDDMPAWKKKALEADPMAAPFGGNWTTEASLSATDDSKMKE